MDSSDSESDSDCGNGLMSLTISKKQEMREILSERYRCKKLQECLNQKANINATNKNGDTVLHMAVKKGYGEIVRFLRQNGARSDVSNRLGHTAVTLDEHLNAAEVTRILKEPVQLQCGENVHQGLPSSKFTPNDDERPSTSRKSDFDEDHLLLTRLKDKIRNLELLLGSSKRKFTTSDELDENPTKRLLLTDNITSERDSCQEEEPRLRGKGGVGLKELTHEHVQEFKYTMLLLHRAWKMGCPFRLGTGMDVGGKSGDIVIEHEDSPEGKAHRFIQVKYKADQTKTIDARQLLTVEDGEFSVMKYFNYWRKIKEHPEFSGSRLDSFTLCTNIGLDVMGLRKADIKVFTTRERNNVLKVQMPRYRLRVNGHHELHRALKTVSSVHKLARELAKVVCSSKNAYLNTKIIEYYRTALAQEVIDIGNKDFFPDFIMNKNLSPKAKKFRQIFLFHAKDFLQRNTAGKDIWKNLDGKKLELPPRLGTEFQLAKPELAHVTRFAKEFVKFVNNASDDNVVVINRPRYNTHASDPSAQRIVWDNIDNLAGHVLITKDEKIKFRPQFSKDGTQLLGDMQKFKNVLKAQLGIKFEELDKYEFIISNFKTCTEEELSVATELPDDDIDNTEIRDFLNKFILAVNQPNEVELGELIKREIGAYSQFNLLHADSIKDSFQNEISNWFERTGKRGKFLAKEDAADFFNDVEVKLSSLITVDLTLEYPKVLKNYGVEFRRENKEVQKFVNGSSSTSTQILELIASEQTLLTSLRVHQTVTQMKKYENNYSFILIRLKTLLLPRIMNRVLCDFEWPGNHDLLVIDCESITAEQYTEKLWYPLYDIIEKNNEKRMILIVRANTNLPFRLQFPCEKIYETSDEISIDNLEKNSQEKLLNKMIISFQGQDKGTSFERLLGIRDSATNDLGRIIDSSTLVQLIQDKKILIGNEVEGLGAIRDYYIPRTIVQHVVIKGAVLQQPNIPDLFVIGGIDRGALEQLMATDENTRECNTKIRHLGNCIISKHGEEIRDFRNICEQNSNRNIHWLEGSSGKLLWKQSRGSITNLMAFEDVKGDYDDDDVPRAAYLTENQLVENGEHHRIVILSASIGMGKSTVLTSLARKMKDAESSLLVIKINLSHHEALLAKQSANRTFDSDDTIGAVDFLVDELSRLDVDLELQVYKRMIKDGGRAVLLFDEFDKIASTHRDVVVDLLQALVKLPIKKLIVATRPHESKALEEKLRTFCHRLQPFSRKEQIEFLTRFWKREFRDNATNATLQKRLERRAERLINLLADNNTIDHQLPEFTRVPSQTRMVAEIFHDDDSTGKRAHSDSADDAPELPERIDIIDLYGRIVDKLYYIYCEKEKSDNPANVSLIIQREKHQNFLAKHKKWALDALFGDSTAEMLLRSQPRVKTSFHFNWTKHVDEDADVNEFIVTRFLDRKPYFIYRNFAAYFAALFLIDTLKDDSRNQESRTFFVGKLFVDVEYKTIRTFLNCLLSGEAYVVTNESWKLDLREHRNANHETLYHVAAQESNIEIVKFSLSRLGEHGKADSEKLQASIDFEDIYGRTPLAIAIDNACNLEVVKFFVQRGANIDWKQGDDSTLLHIAVQQPDNLAVVEYLCEKGADIHSRNQGGNTPLHYAAMESDNLDVVRHLIENGAAVHSKNLKGNTPLHYAAAKSNNLDVVRYLIENGAIDHSENRKGNTPMHTTVAKNFHSLDAVTFLSAEDDVVSFFDMYHRTLLEHYGASEFINSDTAKPVSSTRIEHEDGYTPLHSAREEDIDVNLQYRDGSTPLHRAAAEVGNLNTVGRLINRGANIHFPDHNGCTPLHNAAAQAGNLDIVRHLVENGAIVDVENHSGSTPLHNAVAQGGNMDVVRYLVEKGANVNSPNHIGCTPLHKATEFGNLDIVRHLLKKGADINSRNHKGSTPLHTAASQDGTLDIVQFFLEKDVDVNCRNHSGSTPLHNAVARGGNLDMIKLLLGKGANINLHNHDGRTPLHVAAESGNLDVVTNLLANGADVNSQKL